MSGFVVSVDKNQEQIIKELAQVGICARSVAGARGAGLDIICSSRSNPINLLVEIKMPGKRKELKPSEKWMEENWPGPWMIAETSEEIINWFRVYETPSEISYKE